MGRVMHTGSNKGHRIEVSPDGTRLYVETEEDAFLSVINIETGERAAKVCFPSELDGLGMSPDGKRLVLVDGKTPVLYLVNAEKNQIERTIPLKYHQQFAQIARYSPNGKYLVVTSLEEPVGTILDSELDTQRVLQLGKQPMDMALHPNGELVLISNQGDGTLSIVDFGKAEVVRTVHAGKGIESLSVY